MEKGSLNLGSCVEIRKELNTLYKDRVLIFGDALYIKSPDEIIKNISLSTFDDRVTYIIKAIYIYITF